VVIDDDEPFAADEGSIDLVAVQVCEIGRLIAADIFLRTGMGLEEMVVEELVHEHGIVLGAKLIVTAPYKRVAASASKAVPKLVEPAFVLFQQVGSKKAACERGGFKQLNLFLSNRGQAQGCDRQAAQEGDPPVKTKRADSIEVSESAPAPAQNRGRPRRESQEEEMSLFIRQEQTSRPPRPLSGPSPPLPARQRTHRPAGAIPLPRNRPTAETISPRQQKTRPKRTRRVT
jgi:hypothetical protein